MKHCLFLGVLAAGVVSLAVSDTAGEVFNPESNRVDDPFPGGAFMLRYTAKNTVERSDSKALVRGNGNALMGGVFRFKNDMASGLVHRCVAPFSTQGLGQSGATQVAWQFHATAMTSSRTIRRWIVFGAGRSKKNPWTASLTCSRNSCQESPWVKMASVRHSAEKPPSASCVTSNISSFMDPLYKGSGNFRKRIKQRIGK